MAEDIEKHPSSGIGSQNERSPDQWIYYYRHEAYIMHDGKKFQLDGKDIAALNTRGNYWHFEGSPSSWLCSSTYLKVKSRFKDELPEAQQKMLAAEVLNISLKKLEKALDWNKNYMDWHDGR